jgi:hypothetical protein
MFADNLIANGKAEYVALLPEDRVRSAIRTAIKSYEVQEANDDYFDTRIKPVCLDVAINGAWPGSCSFMAYYQLTEAEMTYEGLLLRLFVATPDAQFEGFALPIFDGLYGRCEPD